MSDTSYCLPGGCDTPTKLDDSVFWPDIESPPRVETNPFAKTKGVYLKKQKVYTSFLFTHLFEKPLAFFYDSTDTDRAEEQAWLRSELEKASANTTNPNHIYAAIDCSTNADTCIEQHVHSTPMFKLYTYGNLIHNSVGTDLTWVKLKQFIDGRRPACN